jgi:hypothetical protein
MFIGCVGAKWIMLSRKTAYRSLTKPSSQPLKAVFSVRWWSSTSFAACGRRQMRFDVDGTFAFRYACGRAHARDGKLTQERRSCSGRVRQDGVARDPGATVIAQHAERVRGMAIANEIPGKQERSGVIMRGPVSDRASALTRRHRGRRDVVLKKNVLHRTRARSGRTTLTRPSASARMFTVLRICYVVWRLKQRARTLRHRAR